MFMCVFYLYIYLFFGNKLMVLNFYLGNKKNIKKYSQRNVFLINTIFNTLTDKKKFNILANKYSLTGFFLIIC